MSGILSLEAFLGHRRVAPLTGGYQSSVYEAVDDVNARCVAKLRDSRYVDFDTLAHQMAAVAELSSIDRRVCGPIPRSGQLVSKVSVDGRILLGTLFEYANGVALDHSRVSDAHVIGVELARLHTSLRTVPAQPIPLVPALSVTGLAAHDSFQLLHGDFSDQNLRIDDGVVRIFDFDDIGYGPIEFEIANSLYMVLFDCTVNDDENTYRRFEQHFRDGYESESGAPTSQDEIARFMDIRVEALRRWVSNPTTAPTGIRAASPEWHRTLASFAESHQLRNRQ